MIKLGKESFGSFEPAVQLVYTWNGAQRQVTAEVWDTSTGAFLPTAALDLESASPQVELTWYRNGETLGAWVEADGQVEGPIEGYNPVPEIEKMRVGVMPQGSTPEISFLFDNVQVWRMKVGSAMSVAPIRISENFEGAVFSAAPTVVGSGISVKSAAAITGSYGLAVDLQNGDTYLRTTWDTADKEMAVRFEVDSSQLSMASGEMFTFQAAGADPTDFSDLSLRLYLSRNNGQTLIASHIYQDSGSPLTLNWTAVPDSFAVLLRLRDSSCDTSGNGFLQLWLDEKLHEVFHVPNGTRLLRWVQLGAHGVDAMTSGILHMDDLTIWR